MRVRIGLHTVRVCCMCGHVEMYRAWPGDQRLYNVTSYTGAPDVLIAAGKGYLEMLDALKKEYEVVCL